MRRLAGVAALLLTGVSAVALAGWVVYSRAAFGTWNPAALPTRISYCGRTYLPGTHLSREQIDAEPNSFGSYPFLRVGTTAGGVGYFARPLPDRVRYRYGSPPLPCDMAVFLKVGADDYIGYGLSGGP